MSVTITKGQTISLSKASADAGKPDLKKLVAGAGWDAKNDKDIDLDLLTVFLGENGKAIADANGNGSNADEAVCAFFNKDPKGAHHHGDNLTGEGDGDDEQIDLNLSDIPAEAKEVAVVVASYSGEKFGEVENAFVRLFNADGDTELGKFNLTDLAADTKGIELGRVVRNGDTWDFKATGTPIAGGFQQIVESYGVTGLRS